MEPSNQKIYQKYHHLVPVALIERRKSKKGRQQPSAPTSSSEDVDSNYDQVLMWKIKDKIQLQEYLDKT